MKKAKSILSLILTLSIVFGMFSLLGVTGNATSPVLTLGESLELDVTEYSVRASFTPERSGRYLFIAKSKECDWMEMEIYDDDYDVDSYSSGSPAYCTVYLYQGETYTISVYDIGFVTSEKFPVILSVETDVEVESVQFSPVQVMQFVEETGGWYDEDGYYYDIDWYWSTRFCGGDQIELTFKDNTKDVFTFEANSRQWLNAEGEQLKKKVQYYSTQGSEKVYYGVEIDGVQSNEFAAEITPNPNAIASVLFEPVEPMTFMEYEGGYSLWNNYYYYQFENYHSGNFCTGDKLTITTKNGNSTLYTYREQSGWLDENGNYLDTWVELRSSQDNYNDSDFWTVGGKNAYWVNVGGKKSNSVSAVILENPNLPASLQYKPIEPITFMEGRGGWYDDEWGFYVYDTQSYASDGFTSGDQLIVTTRAGDDIVYTYQKNKGWLTQDGQQYPFSVEYCDSQYYNQEPWAPGENNYYWVKSFGITSNKVSAVVLDNPKLLIGLEFQPKQVLTFLEETGGRWTTESYAYRNYYYYFTSTDSESDFHDGDVLIATYKNSETETFTYKEGTGWVNEDAELFSYDVEMDYDQYADAIWTVGGTNGYRIIAGGMTSNTISAVIEPNDKKVVSFTFNPVQTYEFYEHAGGWWSAQGQKAYYMYDVEAFASGGFCTGDQITVTLANGSTRTFTFKENEGWLDGEDDLYTLYGARPYLNDNQYESAWTVGSKNNAYWASAFGKDSANKVYASILQNNKAIASVQYQPREFTVVEYTHGSSRKVGELCYYAYNHYEVTEQANYFQEGDTISVTYKDSTSDQLTYHKEWNEDCWEWDEYWTDSQGNKQDIYYDIFSNQTLETAWDVGEHAFLLQIEDCQLEIPVKVVKSNITDVQFTLANPIVLTKGTNAEYMGRDEFGNRLYYYFWNETWFKDSVLTITFDDGSTKDYIGKLNDIDFDYWLDFELPDEGSVDFYANQNDNPWTVGTNYITAYYHGFTFQVPITIVEKPVTSIALEQSDFLTLIENQDGVWKTDAQGNAYFEYTLTLNNVCPNGTVLRVYFEDGSAVTYIKTDRGFEDRTGNLLENLIIKSTQSEQHWLAGDNIAWLSYANKTAAVTVRLHAHEWNEWQQTSAAVAATCTQAGKALVETRTCATCGATETRGGEAIEALGHKYEESVVNPTCTERGYTTYTCERCGESYFADLTDALGHDASDKKVIKPGTTKAGYTENRCSRCHKLISKSNYTAPTGKVKNLKCKTRLTTSQTLTWSKVTGAAGYQVEYSKDGKKWTSLTKDITKTSVTVSKLNAGTSYKVRVRFIVKVDNDNVYSDWTTLTSPTLPKATSIKKVTGATKSFTVQWKEAHYSGYQIRYSTKSNFSGAKTITISSAKTLKKTVNRLSAKTSYFVSIRTFTKVASVKYYSAWSKPSKVKTK